MPGRFRQILLVASILWLSWLIMMLVHECGHVLGALATGGQVRQVVWHPVVISRTDVQPNPHPLIEIWAGPVLGSLVPIGIATMASSMALRMAYLMWVVAGFCLIANGAYIGIGVIYPVGDVRELVSNGMASWPMAAFGLVAIAAGFWVWHRASVQLGFGAVPVTVSARHAYLTFAMTVLVTAVGCALGNCGV